MGKYLIIFCLVGFGFACWRIADSWGKPGKSALAAMEAAKNKQTVPAENKTTTQAPAGSAEKPAEKKPETIEIVIVSSCKEWVQIEGKGLYRKGARLWNGDTLLSWNHESILVKHEGKAVQIFGKHHGEILAEWHKECRDRYKVEKINVGELAGQGAVSSIGLASQSKNAPPSKE